MSTNNKIQRAAAAAILILATATGAASGAAEINFSSSIATTNLRSDGTPMDSAFTFQIGTFSDDFEPTAANTDTWLTHWVPLSDAAGDPIPAATIPFSPIALSSLFPEGTVISGFIGSAELDHNQSPFNSLGAVYIWGFDNRQSPGPGEWLLVTSSTWSWPVVAVNSFASTYSMGTADTVLLGDVNGDGYHMQSAAITISPDSPPANYDSWLAAHFSAESLTDGELVDSVWGALADPDGDGVANVIEYFSASDPTKVDTSRGTHAGTDSDALLFTFYQAKDTSGVVGAVEWSADLVDWRADGVEIESTEDLGDVYRITARIPGAGAVETFARLNVRRILD